MTTAPELQAAYRTLFRTELDDATAARLIAAGTTLDDYIGSLLGQSWSTTGAAVAVAAFVTGSAPSSSHLTELAADARLQLESYTRLGVGNPALGPFEAFGRSFATDPTTQSLFEARYGGLDTAEFIKKIYAELYCGPLSAAAYDSLAGQIAYFDDLLGRANVPDASLAAKGAVLGQLIGYAFLDAGVSKNAVIDDQVAIALTGAAKGDTGLYGKPLPYVVRPCDVPASADPVPSPPASAGDTTPPAFTSAGTASVAENTPAATVVYKADATDPSLPLSYALSGDDALLFSIDATTGEVRFLATPDFEAPHDNGANNVYDIVVTARDTAGNAATLPVAITVTDVDETAIRRISVDNSGAQGNGQSTNGAISLNGRYVAYQSNATNLVPGDTNGVGDVFLYDRQTGTVARISVGDGALQSNGGSTVPVVSQDGRYVAFLSAATNLVSGDTNGQTDVFVRDTQNQTTIRVNVNSNGDQATGGSAGSESLSMSPEGRYVAFHSRATNLVSNDTGGFADIFLRDLQTGQTTRVSNPGMGGTDTTSDSYSPQVIANGSAVFFLSFANTLVANDTNSTQDIFRNKAGVIDRVNLDGASNQGNAIANYFAATPDGRYIAFQSSASNLVAGDTNGVHDIFRKDLQTGEIIRVSVADDGTQADKASYQVAISANGRYVAFQSDATNLVPGDTNKSYDIFVRDTVTNRTSRISVSDAKEQAFGANPAAVGNADSSSPSISADGRFVSFHSLASNLVPGDTNGLRDVFVVDGLAQGWWFNVA